MTTNRQNVLRQFYWTLGIEVYDADLQILDDDIAALEQGFAQLGLVTAGVMAGIATAIGGAAVTLGKFTADTAMSAREAAELAQVLDLGTTAAQEMAGAFRLAGQDTDDLTDAFNTLADRAADAVDGAQSMRDDFKLVGIDWQQLRDLRPEEIWNLYSDAVANSTDVTRRNASVVRTLGDDVGRRLLPLLLRGADGFAALRQEARELGLVLDEETVAAGLEFELQMERMTAAAEGLRNEVGAALLPVVNDLTDDIMAWFRANREIIRQRVRDTVEGIADGLRFVGQAAEDVDAIVMRTLGSWTPIIAGVGVAVTALAGGALLGTLWPALSAIGGALASIVALILGVSTGVAGLVVGAVIIGLAQQFLMLAAAVGGAVLIFDDLNTYLNDGDSLFGRLLETMREGGPTMQAFAGYLEEVVRFGGELAETAELLARSAWAQLLISFAEGRDTVFALVDGLTQLKDLLEGITGLDLGIDDLFDFSAGLLRRGRIGLSGVNNALERGVAQQEAFAGGRLAGTTPSVQQQAVRALDTSRRFTGNTINVAVDASGNSDPGAVGAKVGQAVDQSLRNAGSVILGGT